MRTAMASFVRVSCWPSGMWRRAATDFGVAVCALVLSVLTAAAATTPPVLWTAGGVDAGNGGAGQASRMAVDTAGNSTVVSGPAGGRLLAVTSYTADGVLRWRATAAPVSGTFVGDWVAAAPNGDVVALGHSLDSRGRVIGVSLLRYASDGSFQWRVDSTGSVLSMQRLLVDTAGNAYFGYNSTLYKYSPSGTLLWSTYTSVPDVGATLSPDGADIVLTGTPRGGAVWTTAAFSTATGARRWLVTAAEGTAAVDVVADSASVYVTGQGVTGAGTPSMAYYMTVVAYDRATGARLWRVDKKPADGGSSAGLRIALAPDGSLIVTGQALRGFLDWYTVAFETSGLVRWEAVRDGGLNTDEIPAAVLTLRDGTTVVTGRGGPNLPGGYIPGVTVGYDTSGTLLWEAFSAQATVWAAALPSGDVCASGGYDALLTCWQIAATVAPPAAPSGLTANLRTGAIVLDWLDNATDESTYAVERSEYTGTGWAPYATLATLPANTVTYADASYVARSYNYRVRATNAGGDSAYSNIANITIVSGNDPPTAVMTATPLSGAAPLTVTFDGSGSFDAFGVVTAWTWAFGDGTFGTGVTTTHVYSTPGTYAATLTVTDNGNLSNSTSTSIVVNAPALPSAPTGLTATALSRTSIRLNWTNSTTNQTEVRIERCTGSGCTTFVQVAAVAGTATTYTDSGRASRTTYTYRVRAHNVAGDSTYSNTASARTTR